jgi:hypothetical protein
MFWKKEPEYNALGPDLGPNLGTQRNPGLGSDVFGLSQDPLATRGYDTRPDMTYPSASPPMAFQQMQQRELQSATFSEHEFAVQKELEILSAKIDALRASIESVNQRIINIENIARQDQYRQPRVRW